MPCGGGPRKAAVPLVIGFRKFVGLCKCRGSLGTDTRSGPPLRSLEGFGNGHAAQGRPARWEQRSPPEPFLCVGLLDFQHAGSCASGDPHRNVGTGHLDSNRHGPDVRDQRRKGGGAAEQNNREGKSKAQQFGKERGTGGNAGGNFRLHLESSWVWIGGTPLGFPTGVSYAAGAWRAA